MQTLLAELKQIEQQLVAQQQSERQQLAERVAREHTPAVKYSAGVLEQRQHLGRLIRARNYREAERVKVELRERERAEEERWAAKAREGRERRAQGLERRQAGELQALRARLEAVFNERIKERDRKFEMYACLDADC